MITPYSFKRHLDATKLSELPFVQRHGASQRHLRQRDAIGHVDDSIPSHNIGHLHLCTVDADTAVFVNLAPDIVTHLGLQSRSRLQVLVVENAVKDMVL